MLPQARTGWWGAALLVAVFGASACSSPCDELIEKRCACGVAECQAIRHEIKLETELFKSMGGASAKKEVSARCQARLPSVSCSPTP
jgi:hypothetical protein